MSEKRSQRPGTLTHTRITWALSPMVPQVPGVTLGSPLCPWCCGHSSRRGARQEPKQPGGYSITQGHQNHILRKQVFIQTFMFKRKPTYISKNAIRQWVSTEILATMGEMWGWALCMFRELVKEIKECKKGRTTICVLAEVLDRLLDLYFPHSTHPTQKAAVQREDDLRRAKENERNQFNGPNYLILRRSSIRIVDEASPSNRTEPVPDTTDLLPTPEPARQPTP